MPHIILKNAIGNVLLSNMAKKNQVSEQKLGFWLHNFFMKLYRDFFLAALFQIRIHENPDT